MIAAAKEVQVGDKIILAGKDVTRFTRVEDLPLDGQRLQRALHGLEELGQVFGVRRPRRRRQQRNRQYRIDGCHESSPPRNMRKPSLRVIWSFVIGHSRMTND